jgi:hypothetical protein
MSNVYGKKNAISKYEWERLFTFASVGSRQEEIIFKAASIQV